MENYWIRRAREGSFGRRRFIGGAGVIGAGAAGLALVGCGDDDDAPKTTTTAAATSAGTTSTGASPTGSPAAATPKKGGELTFPLGAPSTQTLDPHTTLNLAFFYWGLIANKLVSPDRKKIEPIQGELVEKWEQVDKTTLLLTVRQGVTYHTGHTTNGRAFNASDVAFNLMRIAGKLPGDEKRVALFQRASTLSGMDKAEAVDEKTVKVTFATPNALFLHGMSDWRNWPVPKEQVDKDPDFKDPKNFAGTGPFMMDSWDQATLAGKYVANPNYWKKGQPYLASVQQVSYADTSASLAAFLSGKLTYIDGFGEERRNSITKGKPDAKILNWEHTGWEYARLNQARDMFKDVRVRQAVHLALNFEDLENANYGKGFWDYTGPLVSGFPGTWSSDEVSKMPGFSTASKAADIANGKKLLEAAGFPNGKGISFAATPSGTTGAWFDNSIRAKDQLEKAYPEMKVSIRQSADGAEFARWLGTGDYDFITYGSFPPPAAPLEAALHYRTGGSRNYTKFSDADVDRMIDAALVEFDNTARAKLMGDLQKKLLDTIFAIPLGKRRTVFATSPNLVGLQEWSGVGTYEYYNQGYSADSVWFS